MKESDIHRKIIKALNALPETFVFKVHGGPYQMAGISDIVGVHRGRPVALEVKRPGGKATAIQLAFLAKWIAAGGVGGVVTSVEEAIELLS